MWDERVSYQENVRNEVEKSLLKGCVSKLLASLSSREKMILEMRYLQDLTLKEIGAECQISSNRVLQIQNKALRKLRHPERMAILCEFVGLEVKELKEREALERRKEDQARREWARQLYKEEQQKRAAERLAILYVVRGRTASEWLKEAAQRKYIDEMEVRRQQSLKKDRERAEENTKRILQERARIVKDWEAARIVSSTLFRPGWGLEPDQSVKSEEERIQEAFSYYEGVI